MRDVLALAFILMTVTLGCQGAPAAAPQVFLPGHEASVEALLAPDDADRYERGGWRVRALSAGPTCRVGLTLVHRDGRALSVTILPADDPTEAGSFHLSCDAAPGDADASRALQSLAQRLRANDPGDFFATRCARAQGVTVAADQADEGPYLSATMLLARAGGFTLLVVVALLGWRRARRAAPPALTEPAPDPWPPSWTALLVVAATLLPRAALLTWLPLGPFEHEFFALPSRVGASFGHAQALESWFWYHGPLLPMLLWPWSALGDALGLGGEIGWLRLPNLLPAVLSGLALLRLGHLLGGLGVGLGAALLFALSPEIILATVQQHSFVWECAMALLVSERAVAIWRSGRPPGASLLAAVSLSLWMSYLSALVVAPVLLVLWLMSRRRGHQRVVLWSFAVIAVFALPVAERALLGFVSYAGASVLSADGVDAAAFVQQYGHPPNELLGASRLDALVNFFIVDGRIWLGTPGLVIAGLGLLLLAWRRWRLGVVCLGPLLLYALAAAVIFLYNHNQGALIPFLLLPPLLGWREVTPRAPALLREGAPAVALLVAVLAAQAPRVSAAFEPAPTILDGAAPDRAGPLRDQCDEAEWRGRPLVILGDMDRVLYELCPAHERASDIVRCITSRPHHGDEHGFYESERAGRRVWISTRAAALRWDPEQCRALEALTTSPPWRSGPSLFVASAELVSMIQRHPTCRAVLEDLASRCAASATPQGLTVLRCPPLI
jgi:hypothetical protein